MKYALDGVRVRGDDYFIAPSAAAFSTSFATSILAFGLDLHSDPPGLGCLIFHLQTGALLEGSVVGLKLSLNVDLIRLAFDRPDAQPPILR